MAFRIEFVEGPHQGESYPLSDSQSVILGRSPSNNIYIKDRNVSRAHCLLRFEGGECMLEDLGSTNGTFVNERRVTETVLEEDDTVRIGLNKFQLKRYADEPLTETTTLLDDEI